MFAPPSTTTAQGDGTHNKSSVYNSNASAMGGKQLGTSTTNATATAAATTIARPLLESTLTVPAAAAVAQSVVPDLMRVYESMTQTSASSYSPLESTATHFTTTAATTTTTSNMVDTAAAVEEYANRDLHLHHHHHGGLFLDEATAAALETSGTAAATASYYSTQTISAADPWDNTTSYEGSNTSSIAIPPPYPLPHLQATPLPPALQQQTSYVSSGAAGKTSTTLSGRPVRTKRSIAAVNARSSNSNNSSSNSNASPREGALVATASDELLNGGYASSTGSSSRGNSHTKSARRKITNTSTNNNTTSTTMHSKKSRTTEKTDTTKSNHQQTSSSKDDKNNNDGRWSKRFTWPDDLHRDFVSAIFDVGLKHSSPSSVMEQMPPHAQITTERIKSHLQKYRLHRQKSKKEFMTSYETTMQQMKQDGLEGVTALASGQVAAHLTYASVNHPEPEPTEDEDMENNTNDDNEDLQHNDNTNETNTAIGFLMNEIEESALTAGEISSPNREIVAAQKTLSQGPSHEEETQREDVFVLPRLTDSEKDSPIGASLGYLMGLFFSLKQQLDLQRIEKQEAAAALQREQENLEQLHQQQEQQQQQHLLSQPENIGVYESFATDAGLSKRLSSGVPMSMAGNAIPVTVPSTTRSNLEENSMMKREMQNQMAFQNKMRALKKQELIKYNKAAGFAASKMLPPDRVSTTVNNSSTDVTISTGTFGASIHTMADPQKPLDYQGAGESGGADGTNTGGRDRSSSVALGDEDDFWNTAVVDDELFDFLMSN